MSKTNLDYNVPAQRIEVSAYTIPTDSMESYPSAGWLVPFLLLGLRERDSYGHDLTRRMTEFGFGTTHTGVMYRALREMEKEGLIVSERDGVACGLSRRRYSITESGEAYLEFWANSLAQYQEEIDLFFRIYAQSSEKEEKH